MPPQAKRECQRVLRSDPIPLTSFTVDTQLFRELGELLVGRDSTALIELIKNAYDADARDVVVFGQGLTEIEGGSIQVRDSGNGMTGDQFESGFLRIASRSKQTDDRRSPTLGRRYTGEKGIGRLAAHKLAHVLEVTSQPRDSRLSIEARIDWDAVERYETLDAVGEDGVRVRSIHLDEVSRTHGTTLRLSPLRRRWSEQQLAQFVAEVQAFEPPKLLLEPLPEYLATKPLLFRELDARDSDVRSPFHVSLEGDFNIGDAMWQELAQSMSWVIEIEAAPGGVKMRTAPTRIGALRDGTEPARGEMPHPAPESGPFFKARILVHEGQKGTQRQRSFSRTVSGVRVYVEGFRVAPYGEPGNDWLDLDRAYSERSYGLTLAGSRLERSNEKRSRSSETRHM